MGERRIGPNNVGAALTAQEVILVGLDGTAGAGGASPPSTGTRTQVASSASAVTLLAPNAGRKGAMLQNDDANVLYLGLGATAPTSTNYTVQVPSGGYYELPISLGGVFTGIIQGIWANAGTGAARVTELT